MRGYFKAILLGLWLTFSLVLSGCRQPQLSLLQSEDVVLAFGDSLTAGYGVSLADAYPSKLQTLIGFTVVNAGVSGETTIAGLKRLPNVLQRYQPRLVILLEGGNDILRKQSKEHIHQNLKSMIELCRQAGADVLLVSVPGKNLFAGGLDLYRELSETFQIPLEDEVVTSLLLRPSMKSDYVHFNSQGYLALAKAIRDKLREAGALN